MTQQTSDVAARARATRRRAIFIGVELPIVVTAIAAVVSASWIPDLPDPVAVHWSGDSPDGFGNVWLFLLTPLAISVLFGIFVMLSVKPSPRGLLLTNQKFVLVTGVWLAGMLSVGLSGTLWVQRGLGDAAEASGGAIWMLWGAIAGLVLAVPAWFVLPESDTVSVAGEEPESIELTPTELVSWSRSVTTGPAPRWIIAGAFVLMFGVAVVTAGAGSPAWIVVAVTSAFLTLLVVATFNWRVTVDRRGLVVRSLVGWPRVTVPADQVQDVAIVDVDPTGEFGGWGWRWAAGGRTGIIMRAGEAIEVTRTNGTRFVVTVDDARTGAALLASVAAPATAR